MLRHGTLAWSATKKKSFCVLFRLVTFVPEMKGKPGKVAMWQYPGADTPITSRSSFRAQVSAVSVGPLLNGVRTVVGCTHADRKQLRAWSTGKLC